MSNKIGGARRKLARVYDLHFLDGPVPLEEEGQLAWWLRDEQGNHILVDDAFDYVLKAAEGKSFDAILGFSQGGALATALAASGAMPSLRAVVTAGSPFVQEAFDIANERGSNQAALTLGKSIPKLHFAGESDAMVPVDSTKKLSAEGGNGKLVFHEKGHLFPTNAASVNNMLEFLEFSLNAVDRTKIL
jgi:predicted esterase